MALARPTLVLGANGLVGSRLVTRLLALGPVIASGRGAARSGLAALGAERIDYLDLDLQREGALRELIAARAPAAVFHAAGLTDVDACERDPELSWALNARSFEQAALGCRSAGARLIAVSTDYVFDGEAGPYGEEDLPNPRGVYARSKRVGEEAALLLAPGAAVCRTAVVFSGVPGSRRTFVDGCVEALRAGREVKAFHDQWVSPSLADDVAKSCIAVWQSGQGGLFHCSGAEVVDRVDFCRRLARRLGKDPALVKPVALAEVKLLAPRPRRCGLKVDKIRALGCSPLGVDAALDQYLRERGEP
jgi:dTDP-4-dehydrorhamnose reductase